MLSQYVKEGVDELDVEKLPALLKLRYGGLPDALPHLGDMRQIRGLFVGFQRHVYEDKA